MACALSLAYDSFFNLSNSSRPIGDVSAIPPDLVQESDVHAGVPGGRHGGRVHAELPSRLH